MVNDGNNCYNGLYGSTVALYVLNIIVGFMGMTVGCKTPIEVFSDIGF